MSPSGPARRDGANIAASRMRAGEGPDAPSPTHLPPLPNGSGPSPPTVPDAEPHPVVDPTPGSPPPPVREPPAGAPPPMRA